MKKKPTKWTATLQKGNLAKLEEAIKFRYRRDMTTVYAVSIVVNGVTVRFDEENLDMCLIAVMKLKKSSMLTFKVTTRTIYVF